MSPTAMTIGNGVDGPPVRLVLTGADGRSRGEGLDMLPGKVNYLVGPKPAQWRTNLTTWRRVRFREVYRHIDIVYYGSRRDLEFDIVVLPGGQPEDVRFRIEGARNVHVSSAGDLIVETNSGELLQRLPSVYQGIGAARRPIPGRYRRAGPNEFRFDLAAYDRSRTLTIDPVITFSGAFGGASDAPAGIASDAAGNAYITGTTSGGKTFPLTPGAYKSTPGGGFVMKLNPGGDVMLYATYIGGQGVSVAVDGNGSAYVAGPSRGGDIGCPQAGRHGFALKLSPGGDELSYFKCLASMPAKAIAIDKSGSMYITGSSTFDSSLPVTAGAPQTKLAGLSDAFIAKLDPAGSRFMYLTYLGGSGSEEGRGIAVDGNGNAYVTGVTSGSPDFPVVQAFQSTAGGGTIMRSTDIGATFLPAGNGLPPTQPNLIAPHPANPAISYVLFTSPFLPYSDNLYKTTNRGSSWALVGKLPNTNSTSGAQLIIDPINSSILYFQGLPGNSLWKSTDGGTTWKIVPVSFPKSIALDPHNPSVLYAATFEGALTKSIDAAATWQTINVGAQPVTNVAVDPTNSTNVYAIGNTTLFKSSDSGAHWSALAQGPQFESAIVTVAPSDGSVLYASRTGPWISTDSGKTWRDTGFFTRYITIDPSDPKTFYFTSMDAFGRATITGATAQVTYTSVPSITALAFDAGHPAALYVTREFGRDAFVTKINAAGTQWVYSTFFGGSGADFGNAIAVDAVGNAYIAGSTNSPNLPTTAGAIQTAFRPSESSTIIWRTATFETLGQLPDAFVAKLDPSGSKLLLGTYLGGNHLDVANAIALEPDGSILVAGSSQSPDFPLTSDSAARPLAFGNVPSTNPLAFVTKLSADANRSPYSAYTGGTEAVGIALDPAGNALVTGTAGPFSPFGVGPPNIAFVAIQFAAPSKPLIATHGILDVFSAFSGRAAPGSIVSIFGSSLAGSTAQASFTPLPVSLAGTSVTIDGCPAPLFYVSAGQINMQVPYETRPGVSQVIVNTAAGQSLPAAMIVNAASPNILVDLNTNRAIAFNQDGSFNSSDNPAPTGSAITVYMTGQGLVTNGPATGAVATGAASATLPVAAKVGPAGARVQYLGLTPQSVGLAQANVMIPNLPSSDYPLIITVGGVASNWSTISVTEKH